MAICCGGVVSLQRECFIGQCDLSRRKLADRQRRNRRHAGALTGTHRHVRTRAGRRAHAQRHVSKASWKRLQTTSDRVTAAQRAVSAARPAEAEDLRVLGAGVTGKMLLAGARPEC